MWFIELYGFDVSISFVYVIMVYEIGGISQWGRI